MTVLAIIAIGVGLYTITSVIHNISKIREATEELAITCKEIQSAINYLER